MTTLMLNQNDVEQFPKDVKLQVVCFSTIIMIFLLKMWNYSQIEGFLAIVLGETR